MHPLSPLISEVEIQTRIKELAEEINSRFSSSELVCICVLNGAFMFFSDLIRAMNRDVYTEFLGCSSYGDSTKSSGEVRLTLDLTHSIRDRDVLIVEDIVDTGVTLRYLQESLQARQPRSLATVSLLFKPESLSEKNPPELFGFKVGREFLVGYGLDYQGFYRNLPYIARLNNFN